MDATSLLPVEVEYKFLIPHDIEARLAAIGALLVEDLTFTDVYLDTPEHVLALSDTWLRRRDGVYQLKYVPSTRVKSAVQQYGELVDVALIGQRITEIFNESADVPQCYYVLENLEPFAEITTHRKEYRIGSVVIDLDQTDFGYGVGEVEIMSKSQTDLQETVNEVNKVVSSLDVQTDKYHQSKLVKYLSVHNPPLRNKLWTKLGL